jgi:hypothetical protein
MPLIRSSAAASSPAIHASMTFRSASRYGSSSKYALTRPNTGGPEGIQVEPGATDLRHELAASSTPRRLRRRRERRIRKRLEAEAIERLVAEYDGDNCRRAWSAYGIAKSSVLGLVRQAREQVRHPRLSTTQTAVPVALYEAGLSQVDIAERLGRRPSAVWHCLRRLGFVGSPRSASD